MPVRATRIVRLEPSLPAPLEPLRDLAWNLRWSWQASAGDLFRYLDPSLWESSGHNPVRLLQMLPRERLEELATDGETLRRLGEERESLHRYLGRSPRLRVDGLEAGDVVAYFSLEFALAECLPNYSGGLGVLAGDHLKSASDLGLPFVGVSLMYREGYFQQSLRVDGWQQEEYPANDFWSQPARALLGEDGAPITVSIPVGTREVAARVWTIDVGQARLLLLDTNVESNAATDREITGRLYGGDLRMRIQQEMVLGIGGIRALAAVGLRPVVCHMNEGHSALLNLERIRTLMAESGATFDEARLPVSAGSVFTTHTAVAAGIDLLPPELLRSELGPYAQSLGLDEPALIALGRMQPTDAAEPFSMALLGLRLSNFRNAVSKLHRGVARRLWEGAWPDLPVEQRPIESITNGVHTATWVAPELTAVYDRHLGPEWRDQPARPGLWDAVEGIDSWELWRVHSACRARLVARANQQYRRGSARRTLNTGWRGLDPEALTVGFARRFATYKRATLLFHDLDRLARIIGEPGRPVQIILAGKAHPMDDPGKQILREVVEHSRRPELNGRVVVLEGHDLALARELVQGCDAWLNTPLRPLEASGTSGMKAAANGVLHASVLDGWWHEAYAPRLGWTIGEPGTEQDPEVQDAIDAASVYDLLEREIVPAFYERDGDGLPHRWVGMMKATIRAHASTYNTDRMVTEYVARAYAPAAEAWVALTRDGLAGARELAGWITRVRSLWDQVEVGSVEEEGPGQMGEVGVRARIRLGALRPEEVQVSAVSGPARVDGTIAITSEGSLRFLNAGGDGLSEFGGAIPVSSAGSTGFAVRVVPAHPHLRDPFSPGLVTWS